MRAFPENKMIRTAFLIDGFNLYHSVRRAGRELNGATTKWLDIHSLCKSYLYVLGPTHRIERIFYFSALAKHLEATNPDVTKRHRDFIKCLESTGIVVELARFKEKEIWCPFCNQRIVRHEEKETDVAISVKLMELFCLDLCDTAILMTGDTDVAPAVRTAKRLFPKKQIGFAFPYGRKDKELAQIADVHFNIKKQRYIAHQFLDPVVLPSGQIIMKPSTW